jgi:GNAT superfamily N-acetyltransferase
MRQIEIRPFCTSDRDWLVAAHAEVYAREAGFDDSFGVLVAQILDACIAQHDPEAERGWIAWEGETRLGSIFCVRLDATTAKLRLFLLTPQARGQGIGHRLLQTCTGFARDCGYADMQLWTHKSHEAACALYKRNGWSLGAEKPVLSFGQPLIEQTFTLALVQLTDALPEKLALQDQKTAR